MILGPVGVGKTFLATALGHIAVRRGRSVHFERADVLLKRLKATRLDNSHDTEVRKLLRVDVLILDDFALRPMGSVDTAEVYDYADCVIMPRGCRFTGSLRVAASGRSA